jgi:hypothetical protein
MNVRIAIMKVSNLTMICGALFAVLDVGQARAETRVTCTAVHMSYKPDPLNVGGQLDSGNPEWPLNFPYTSSPLPQEFTLTIDDATDTAKLEGHEGATSKITPPEQEHD